MSRFFVQASAIQDSMVSISGTDAFHIARALRMTVGEKITVCDMQGNEYTCALVKIRDDVVYARILAVSRNDTELCCRVRLYQSLAKGEKMDYIVQKAVELGVDTIVPVLSARCVMRLREEQAAQKCVRWQRIADSAAKQSGRGTLVQVLPLIPLQQALQESTQRCKRTLFCYEGDGTTSLKTLLQDGVPESVGFFVGPEGGYDFAEVAAAQAVGASLAGLGKRILRCETASGFVLSCLIYQSEL